MQVFEVMGFKKQHRTSKQSGREYDAYNLYLGYEDRTITGFGCTEVFVMADIVPSDIHQGDKVHVLYNRFGRVEAIERA